MNLPDVYIKVNSQKEFESAERKLISMGYEKWAKTFSFTHGWTIIKGVGNIGQIYYVNDLASLNNSSKIFLTPTHKYNTKKNILQIL